MCDKLGKIDKFDKVGKVDRIDLTPRAIEAFAYRASAMKGRKMRRLFDGTLTQAERIAHVARMFDLSPDHPETWPKALIEQLLHDAECQAEAHLRDSVRMFGAGFKKYQHVRDTQRRPE